MEGFGTSRAKEKDEMLMLRESFHQLSKLQEECNQELSTFQRENFVAQEEFRAISAHLCEKIDEFQRKINDELDKMSLRINQLEIIAMFSFKCERTPIISNTNGHHLACANGFALIATVSGTIKTYNITTGKVVCEAPQSEYDPLQVHGKITQFYATTRLFVGFTDGIIIAFDLADLSKRVEMNYHNAAVTAIHEFGEYVATGCNDGVVVLWSASTLQRLVILPVHRLPIVSIRDNGTNWVIADTTGVISMHDRVFSKVIEKSALECPVTSMFVLGKKSIVTVSDKLLMWDGTRVIKTFNAVPIEGPAICCMKQPEMLVLGSTRSTELRFVFLQSLLFPKTVNILDSPPISITQYNSFFYVLTKNGNVVMIEPMP